MLHSGLDSEPYTGWIILLVGLPLLYPQCLAQCLPFSQCSVSVCGINKVKVEADKYIKEDACSFPAWHFSGNIYSLCIYLFNTLFFLLTLRYMEAGTMPVLDSMYFHCLTHSGCSTNIY